MWALSSDIFALDARDRVRLQQMQWADALLVCIVAIFLCGSYLFCFLYRRCFLRRKRRYDEMAQVPSAALEVGDMEEPLLARSAYDELPTFINTPLAQEYQPSAPPLSWESEPRGSPWGEG